MTDVYKFNVEDASFEKLSDSLNRGRKHHGCATYEDDDGYTRVRKYLF